MDVSSAGCRGACAAQEDGKHSWAPVQLGQCNRCSIRSTTTSPAPLGVALTLLVINSLEMGDFQCPSEACFIAIVPGLGEMNRRRHRKNIFLR